MAENNPTVDVTEEVIEEIDVGDGADPAYQIDPAMAARLLSGGRGNQGLISALQGQLAGMIGRPSDLIENLPRPLRNRLAYLGQLQDQHDELEEKLQEEQDALQKKYDKLQQPLFAKRAAIVQGKEEAPDALGEDDEEEAEEEEGGEGGDVAGIPDFWLHVLQSHADWDAEIQEKDEEILTHLIDLRVEDLGGDEEADASNKLDKEDDNDEEEEEDEPPKGFRIIFEFSDNPFFSNKELIKTYYMSDADPKVPMLQRATGSTIQWASNKNPGVKLQKKKAPKGKGKPPPVRSTKVPTFFDFFSPPPVPESNDLTEEETEILQVKLSKDYELGEVLRDELIPYAVNWFTGEANMDDDDDEEDDEDDEEEDADEEAVARLVQNAVEIDEEGDEDEDVAEIDLTAKPSKQSRKGGKSAAAAAGAGSQDTPPDCKQQ